MSKYAALVANDCGFAKKNFKKYEFINNERVGETEQFYRHDKHFLRIEPILRDLSSPLRVSFLLSKILTV